MIKIGLMKKISIALDNKRQTCKKCRFGNHENMDVCYECIKTKNQFIKRGEEN